MTTFNDRAREITGQLLVSVKYNQYLLDEDKRTSEQFNYFNEKFETEALTALNKLHEEECLRVIGDDIDIPAEMEKVERDFQKLDAIARIGGLLNKFKADARNRLKPTQKEKL